MSDGDRIGAAHHVLDHQLVDSRGERCGKVDDLVLARGPNGDVEMRAVLAGPGALKRRVRHGTFEWLTGLAGDREVEVPWDHVAHVQDHVTLTLPAPDIGLSQGEERAANVLRRILRDDADPVRLGPKGVEDSPTEGVTDDMRLSYLLGMEARDQQAQAVGHVHEIVLEKSGRVLNEAAGNAWVVVGASVGRHALAFRLGFGRDKAVVREIVSWPTPDQKNFVLGAEITD